VIVCRNPSCYQWPLRTQDRYCSWCGECLVELQLEFEELRDGSWQPLNPAVLTSDRRPSLRLTVRNRGQLGKVTVGPQSLKSLTPWLAFEPVTEARPVEPGGDQSINVTSYSPPEDYQGRLLARASLRTEVGERTAEFEVVPLPRFSVTAVQQLQLSETQPSRCDLRLRLEVGRTALLRAPRWLEEWGTIHVEGVEFPLEMDPQNQKELGLKLTVEPALARSLRGSSERKLAGTLQVECVGREQVPLSIPADLGVQLTAQMVVEPFRDQRFHRFHRLAGINEGDPLRLTFSNGPGSEELVVHRIEVDAEPAWLKPPPAPPRRLPAGRSVSVNLPLDLSVLRQSTAQARIRILSNQPQVESYTVEVSRVVPESYPGHLVVDLGTSNTCAVLVDEFGNPREVLLDDNPPTATLPSILYYERLDGERRCRPGHELAAGDPGLAGARVAAAKRFLGEPEHRFAVFPFEEPDRFYEVSPVEATADLYRWVLRRAHEQLLREPGHRVLLERALITHPSRFSMHQLDALRSAFLQALASQHLVQEPRLELLQEPVGGALAFLHQPERAAEAHRDSDEASYPLLVYDFGGGTVDITLLQVTSRRRPLPAAEAAELSSFDQALLLHTVGEQLLQRCTRRAQERRQEPGEVGWPQDWRDHQNLQDFLHAIVAAARQGADWEELRRRPDLADSFALPFYQGGDEIAILTFTREESLPSLDELTDRLPALTGGYRYSLKARVLGATGHRRCGGEDVTRALQDLLVERIQAYLSEREGAEVELPLDPRGCPAYQVLTARKNSVHLRVVAETLKIALAEERTGDFGRQVLAGYADGRECQVGPSELAANVPLPTLAELEAAVRGEIAETIAYAQRLLAAHKLQGPEVVLAIGQASRFPLVERLLREAFPKARFHRPPQAKECVVQGAALHASRTVSDSSIRVHLEKTTATTTSRLGIRGRKGAVPVFSEVVSAGVSIPMEGLSVPIPVGLQPGPNRVSILENLGLEDRVTLEDGQRNPDLVAVRSFEFELDEDLDPFDLEDGELTMHIAPTLDLSLRIKVQDQELTFDPVSSSDFGRSY